MRAVLSTLAAIATIAALAETPDVSVAVSLIPAELPFHKTGTYTIVVEGAAGAVADPPVLTSPTPDLRIKASALETEELPDERVRVVRRHTVQAIRPGYYLLPSREFTGPGADALTTPPLVLHVRDLSPAEREAALQFAANTLPSEVAGPPQWWPIALGVAAALLAAAAGYFALGRWRRRDTGEPELSQWARANHDLDWLEQSGLATKGAFGPFYVELSRILRRYIEDRFDLHAPEQTTPEFLEAAKTSGLLSEEHQKFLHDVLRVSDRVKFAQFVPNAESMGVDFRNVRAFVSDTTPNPMEPPQAVDTEPQREETA